MSIYEQTKKNIDELLKGEWASDSLRQHVQSWWEQLKKKYELRNPPSQDAE